MNKRKYTSPDLDIVSLTLFDVLKASKYTPEPEDPIRKGDDEFEGEL